MRKILSAIALNVVNKATTAIIFFFLARWAGAEEAGIYTLGLSYTLLFGALVAGLDDLLIRESNFDPAVTVNWFLTLGGLRFFASIILWGGIAALVWILPYPGRTTLIIITLGSTLVPDGLVATCNSLLIARRKVGLAAGLAALIGVLKVGAAIWALTQGTGLLVIAVIVIAVSWVAVVLYLSVARVELGDSLKRPKTGFSLKKIDFRRIAPFLFIGSLSTLEYQFDVLFLSILAGETEVGWYSSSTTFLWALWMIPVAYRMVYFPIFSQMARHAPGNLPPLFWKTVQYLASFIFPVVAAMCVLSPSIIGFVYGDGYEPSGAMLATIVWALPFVYMGVPNMRVLLAFERQDLAVRFLVITLTVNVVGNLVLIPWLGGLGAAMARVFSSAAFWLISWHQARRYVEPMARAKEYFPLAVATLTCTGLIWLGRHWSLFVVIPVGMVTYLAVLWKMGGIPLELKGVIQSQVKGRFNV